MKSKTLKTLETLVATAKPEVNELLQADTSPIIKQFLDRMLWMLDTIEGELDYQKWCKEQAMPDPDNPFAILIRRTEKFINEVIGEDFKCYDGVADDISDNREFSEAHSFELKGISVTIFYKGDYDFSFDYHTEKPLSTQEQKLLEFIESWMPSTLPKPEIAVSKPEVAA